MHIGARNWAAGVFFWLLSTDLPAAEYDYEKNGPDDHIAAFHLWVPDGLSAVQNVIVLVPGFNGDGRGLTQDATWRELAARRQCALLGVRFQGASGGAYAEAKAWSGAVLLGALSALAHDANLPELDQVKLLLWGHSAGGQFNFNFACWKPARVAAFIVNKGAYYGPLTNPATEKIPALFILGTRDTPLRVGNITALFSGHRARGARWALVPEPGIDHAVGRSPALGVAFFDAVLGRADDDPPWTGVIATHEIRPFDEALDNPPTAATGWLPNEAFAKLWQDVVTPREGAPAPAPATESSEKEATGS